MHFDADIVNADEIPAMNYPARIVAISMTAWETELDADGRSERMTMDLFRTLVG